ncbi:bifunctional UDP-N-acetylglucosamine diphosphorylase/glucosamine-1-phosphate N-acetyltransferase GlmU [Loigolactobacillus zhaoyuanensis]|uniref:Bifunctional protein GlmU n=1 Tax=Loigolactobacillus zhaoyuanensis TaxID=2486017 RepID=A0ABW8UAW8_9LACO|nr:bifunctional UDP-N-acetylglucosamine diphosphorylase/glucosamine-1-phosphate N-acetyltransferase GlmU [Loigolactobacillus zhaoyuanensis]
MIAKYTVILAAGQGTRMKSKLAKVLHPVCGRPMVDHVLTQAEKLHPDKIVTVIGHGAAAVKTALGQRTDYAVQTEQNGSGDAVLRTEDQLGAAEGMTMVVSGDTPLLTAKTFEQLFEYHKEKGAKATVLTATAADPTGYGRIVRNELGVVEKIVEQKDASREEAAITEINTGVYCFDNQALFAALHEVGNENAQGEYYLTDVIGILKNKGEIVSAYRMKDFTESLGVNTRAALAQATKIMQQRINDDHMTNGVTLVDPAATHIDIDVKIGADTTIEAGVTLKGKTVIGNDCYISTGSALTDATIGNDVRITSSTIEESSMADHSNIGPMSHLRPQSEIGEYVHIGNFCEVKKAQLGAHTKMGHLSYVGDATLGEHINIGCGVVFVNYDGLNKHHSTVGDWSFIGSNANIVAPVKVADHAFVAAGSTITADVDFHEMAIARGRQVNKADYWAKLPHEPEN